MPTTSNGGNTGYAATPWENNRHARARHAATLPLIGVATGPAVSNPSGVLDNPTTNWS